MPPGSILPGWMYVNVHAINVSYLLTRSGRLKLLGRESIPESHPDSEDSTEVLELFPNDSKRVTHVRFRKKMNMGERRVALNDMM